jgi:hypothetical protein
MKQIAILFLLMTIIFNANAQDENLQLKLDSIIDEADLMYKYEKSVWNSTDLLMADPKLKKNYGGYVVRHSMDSIFVTYLDKNQKESIARYIYVSANLNKPCLVSLESSSLTILEKELLDIKIKILNQLSDSKYNITIPQGFNPNFVLIKEATIFKLYLIMGTAEYGVIPFGNDYLFWSDSDGNITNWKKFHSRLIPIYAKGDNGEKVVSSSHSHLKTTPYITATDICTFRLYGELCEMEEFSVLCTATGKYYKYKLLTNKIEVEEI